jgi:hypothetical protein
MGDPSPLELEGTGRTLSGVLPGLLPFLKLPAIGAELFLPVSCDLNLRDKPFRPSFHAPWGTNRQDYLLAVWPRLVWRGRGYVITRSQSGHC